MNIRPESRKCALCMDSKPCNFEHCPDDIIQVHASEWNALAEENQTLKASLELSRELIVGIADYQPCQIEQHGYCTVHYIVSPCVAAAARETLEKLNAMKASIGETP